MTALAFDTLKLSRQLVKAGFNEAQADAVLEVAREAHDTADLATKADLRELELRVDARFEKIHADIATAKSDTIKWLVTLLLAQAGLVAALVKML